MLPFTAILWPTDESRSALLALEAAIEMAETSGARLYALQVVGEVPTIPETGFASAGVSTGFDVVLYQRELVKTAQRMLDETVAEHVPRSVNVEAHVLLGWPADTIVRFVAEKKVDLIVMATHGRTGFSRFMLGSVTEKVIRQSPVPVLAIPAAPEERK